MELSTGISLGAVLIALASLGWSIHSGRRSNRTAEEALEFSRAARAGEIEAARPIMQIRATQQETSQLQKSYGDRLVVMNVGKGSALSVSLQSQLIDPTPQQEHMWADYVRGWNEEWAKGNRTIEPNGIDHLHHTHQPLSRLRAEISCRDIFGNCYVYRGDKGRLELVESHVN